MATKKRTVLITGCSEGGLGAALAVAFHNAGFHVYATARNPAKMASLVAMGIETMTLDVLSDSSIAECAAKVPSLDILVNNAGGNLPMPMSDLSITEAKKLFDLNVWSYLAVTKAFEPLLIESKGMIVNQTSCAGVCVIPFQAAYNASKAAISMFSDTMRLEYEPFGITVVNLRTGLVNTNIIENGRQRGGVTLPKGSIYDPARDAVEKTLRVEGFDGQGSDAGDWAKEVVKDLLKKSPPPNIWRGKSVWLVWFSTILPFGAMDNTVKKMTGLDVVGRVIGKK